MHTGLQKYCPRDVRHRREAKVLGATFLSLGRCGGGGVAEVAVESGAIEGDDDDFAAVDVVAAFLVFGDIQDGEGEVGDVAVFEKHAGTFDVVPVIDGSVGVAEEVGGGVAGEPAVGPVVDAIWGG